MVRMDSQDQMDKVVTLEFKIQDVIVVAVVMEVVVAMEVQVAEDVTALTVSNLIW